MIEDKSWTRKDWGEKRKFMMKYENQEERERESGKLEDEKDHHASSCVSEKVSHPKIEYLFFSQSC